jgi:CRP-like cAMP-binding protein
MMGMRNDLDAAERAAVLRRCAIFAPLGQETLTVLSEMMRVERYAAGEVVFNRGEAATEILVVADGALRVQLPGGQPVRAVTTGDILGEFGMFGQRIRTATVEAESDALLLLLDYERFTKFLLEFPESALALLEVAVGRMVENLEAAAGHG